MEATLASNGSKKLSRKEKRLQKKIAKYESRPISSFPAITPYLHLFTRPDTIPTTFRFWIPVFRTYFGLQYKRKWGISKTPIVHVDHELDQKIPFRADKVHIYMHFINMWVKSLSMLIHQFGAKDGCVYCREWLKVLTKIYHESARIYKFRLSTMERPKYHKGKFFWIHALDPHLLCVPSLHIAIIASCYAYFRNLFKRGNFSDKEEFLWTTELYNDAVEIAESVLYVKQHSVNCVPAALYMVTILFPDIFTPNDATNFINDLFLSANDISAEDKATIKAHISFMYERFLLEGAGEDDWTEPVKRWLVNYSEK